MKNRLAIGNFGIKNLTITLTDLCWIRIILPLMICWPFIDSRSNSRDKEDERVRVIKRFLLHVL